jgi:putative membrane protein
MVIAGLVLAGLAALFHVYVFYLESLAWSNGRTRAAFGTTVEDAAVTKPLAFNQGFYNLFLAIVVVTGIVAFAANTPVVGATLVFAGAGSMIGAGLVLLLSNRDLARAALAQLVPPLLAVILLAVGLLN